MWWFVWEWCDHAIAHGTAENGKTICLWEEIMEKRSAVTAISVWMDWYFVGDRTVHTGLLEYRMYINPE